MTTKTKKAESTELAVISSEEQAYINKVKGEQGIASEKPTGPSDLVINTIAKDADGVRRAIGSWHIRGTDKYFDGEIKFRPIAHFNKLIRYAVDEHNNYTVAGQSVYFKNFDDVIYDTTGGIALGRKFGKQYSQEEKDATRNLAQFYLEVFGIATLGDEEFPCRYKVRGSKITKLTNAFRAIPKTSIMSQYNFKLETNQPAGKTYWDINVTPDMSTQLRLTTDIIKADEAIHEYVKSENDYVMTAYKNARNNKTESNIIDGTLKDITPVNPEEDELPF